MIAAHPLNAPGKRQDRGRDSKRQDIGKRIQLRAKFRARSGQSGDSAIKAIENVSDADRDRRLIVLPLSVDITE